MKKIFVPSNGPEDWKKFLAEPEKQWKSGYSAKALAYCWEDVDDGFPPCVSKVFRESEFPLLREMEILLALPEYKVMLPGGGRPSQSDIMVLARSNGKLITIAVEGKVAEPFGPTVKEWLKNASSGKRARLDFLVNRLGLEEADTEDIRYQLLHRTVSALICAERFNASVAVMLVHSFSQDHVGLDDYDNFAWLFGQHPVAPGSVVYAGDKDGIGLYLAWARGDKQYLDV